MTTTSQAQERAQETASATADETKHVGHVAGQEAGHVAEEAMNQVRNLADEAKDQLTDQSRVQRDRLVDTMRTFSGDLERMASGDAPSSGLASDLVRQAAERTRGIYERLDGREPGQILDDVRSFARRRPGTFLLGALAAGIVAGRMARGAKDGSSSATSDQAQVSTTPEYDATQAGPAYDETQAGSAFDEPMTTDVGFAGDAGAMSAPQPVTGPLDVEPGTGGHSGPGTL